MEPPIPSAFSEDDSFAYGTLIMCVYLHLTLSLLVADLLHIEMMTKNWEMTETLTHGYSSESIQRELSYEYDMTWLRSF